MLSYVVIGFICLALGFAIGAIVVAAKLSYDQDCSLEALESMRQEALREAESAKRAWQEARAWQVPSAQALLDAYARHTGRDADECDGRGHEAALAWVRAHLDLTDVPEAPKPPLLAPKPLQGAS